MIEKGAFYSNLRMASIKRIPKKCDCEQIKNWRPISLLSNIYKIYSKAFANRLKRNIDQNTSNTQKAYSTKKTIHKALMNILQCLKKSIKKTNLICVTSLFFIFTTRNKNSIYNISKMYDFFKYHMNNYLSFLN